MRALLFPGVDAPCCQLTAIWTGLYFRRTSRYVRYRHDTKESSDIPLLESETQQPGSTKLHTSPAADREKGRGVEPEGSLGIERGGCV